MLMKVECKQRGMSERSEEPRRFFVKCWMQHLLSYFLKRCCIGTGGREGTHSLDLSLITAYLVVNNSDSAGTVEEMRTM